MIGNWIKWNGTNALVRIDGTGRGIGLQWQIQVHG